MGETYGTWPYQVAFRYSAAAVIAATDFCARNALSLRTMGPQVTFEGVAWAVFRFSRHDDADYFRTERRGRWVHAHLWRRADYGEAE